MCQNEKCEQYRAGFTINGIWPLGNIDDVLKQEMVQINKGYCEGLEKLKAEGREYSCIRFPNDEDVPYAGYRVQKWCPSCCRICSYDAMITEENPEGDAEEVVAEAGITSQCPECKGFLMDFDDVVADGIDCPFCHEKMEQNRWFSNVRSEDPSVNQRYKRKEEA